MSKIRIAFMGINENIFEVIKREINPRNTEIVFFLDNDVTKQGICYENIPILAPDKQLFESCFVDYILVTTLTAYQSVYKQLVDLGIPKEKIQVFVAEDIRRYCVGSIDNIDKELIKQIYFEPQKILDIVAEYTEIYKAYVATPVFEEEPEGWFNKSRLISHACGGVVNGQKAMYSNSKEAFQYTVEKGFKLMECDLMQMDNGDLLLAHDYGRLFESEQGRYSALTLEELLRLLKRHREISCLIDVKWKDYDEYTLQLNEIDRLIAKVTDNDVEKAALKQQIIMEVYDEETIKIAKKGAFSVIFTQYRNPRSDCFMETAILCHKYGVKAIAMDADWCLKMKKHIKILVDKNIKIFAFSTDSVERYSELRKINVTGVFTNYLTERKSLY